MQPLPSSCCPRVVALLSTLAQQGLVDVVVEGNAEVFVKWKLERKCALIVNMKMFNRGCKFKARPFKLPSMEGLVVLLRDLGLGGRGRGPQGGLRGISWTLPTVIGVWSPPPPPPPLPLVHHQSGDQRHIYAFLCVPFGWHQAPGDGPGPDCRLAQGPGQVGVVTVQNLDDSLFVGSNPTEAVCGVGLHHTARLLYEVGFPVSKKFEFQP